MDFSASNSSWLMAPESSSSLARAISSAGPCDVPATCWMYSRCWASPVCSGRHLPLGHAPATSDQIDQRAQPGHEDQQEGPPSLPPATERAVAEEVEQAAEPHHQGCDPDEEPEAPEENFAEVSGDRVHDVGSSRSGLSSGPRRKEVPRLERSTSSGERRVEIARQRESPRWDCFPGPTRGSPRLPAWASRKTSCCARSRSVTSGSCGCGSPTCSGSSSPWRWRRPSWRARSRRASASTARRSRGSRGSTSPTCSPSPTRRRSRSCRGAARGRPRRGCSATS